MGLAVPGLSIIEPLFGLRFASDKVLLRLTLPRVVRLGVSFDSSFLLLRVLFRFCFLTPNLGRAPIIGLAA